MSCSYIQSVVLATVQVNAHFVEAQMQPIVFASCESLDALLQHDYSQRACGQGRYS